MSLALAETDVRVPHDVIDHRRGTWAMLLFILSEATLFLILFFSYYYLRHVSRGPFPSEPPKLTLAFVMLGVLVTSSVVLHLGERAERAGRTAAARLAIVGTILLGVSFLTLQAFEYRDHLKTLRPDTDAYGSIFYTMTSFHAAHLLLGLLMLAYVAVLPEIGPGRRPPHRPLHNVSLYWHFVDAVWLVIVLLIYVAPNIRR